MKYVWIGEREKKRAILKKIVMQKEVTKNLGIYTQTCLARVNLVIKIKL